MKIDHVVCVGKCKEVFNVERNNWAALVQSSLNQHDYTKCQALKPGTFFPLLKKAKEGTA